MYTGLTATLREHSRSKYHVGPGVHTNTASLYPSPYLLPVLTSPEVVVNKVLFMDLKSSRWFMVAWRVSQEDCRDDSALGTSEHVFPTLSGSLNGMWYRFPQISGVLSIRA